MTKQELLTSLKRADAPYVSETDPEFQRAVEKVKILRDTIRNDVIQLEKDGYSSEIRALIEKYRKRTGRDASVETNDFTKVVFSKSSISGSFLKKNELGVNKVSFAFPSHKSAQPLLYESDETIDCKSIKLLEQYYKSLKEHETALKKIKELLPKLYDTIDDELNREHNLRAQALSTILDGEDRQSGSQSIFSFDGEEIALDETEGFEEYS